MGLAVIDAIWIQHLHPDHCADLLAAWNAYANDDSLPQPTVYGPLGWADRLDAMTKSPKTVRIGPVP